MSEGTYPFAMGGVSVWCDQLIRGLPRHEFEFVALTVDHRDQPLWPAPPNLVALRTIALWTPSDTPRAELDDPGRGAVADLVAELVRPLPDDTDEARLRELAFLDALRRVASVARRRASTSGLLTSDDALDVLLQRWRAETGHGLPLHDALEWSDLLEHLLRPLAEAPVRADVVHAAMNGPSMLVGMAAHWAHGTPVVMSEHGIYLRERYLLEDDGRLTPPVRFLRLNFFRLLAAASYRVAAAIAPHSRYNRRWQLRCGADPARMHTMYNGVHLDDFPVATDEPDLPTVSFLGRIDPVKDVRTLVNAFTGVHRSLPHARLRVFGAAPLGQEDYLLGCRQLTADLGLERSVTFEGPTRTPVDAYHSGSVVALSSISEGFPYSIVEAMACGRPVVCTNVGGVAEAVGDGGLVVPPQNPDALGRALTQVLGDQPVRARMGRAARDRVVEMFTVQRWVGAYDDLYTEVAGTLDPAGRHGIPLLSGTTGALA